MKDFKIELSISPKDFEETFNKLPTEIEFKEFCRLCEQGLRNGQIDWDIIFDCAKGEMNNDLHHKCPACHMTNHKDNTHCWNCKKPFKEVNK